MNSCQHTGEILIGVISDTHGLVRPEAIDALRHVEMILHAGDVGNRQVLESLSDIAPVTAVRGNNDKGEWAAALAEREALELGGISVYMLHDLNELGLDPSAAGYRVVISGHSHKPHVEEREGVLYLNPGSAGPRRFKLPVGLAYLKIIDGKVEAQLVELSV